MHRTENKYNRLIKTEVTDVSSPREVCYALVSAYNKNYMR